MEKVELKGLNIKELLKSRPSTIVSTKEALKDVEPFNWGEDVVSGKVKVIITDKR